MLYTMIFPGVIGFGLTWWASKLSQRHIWLVVFVILATILTTAIMLGLTIFLSQGMDKDALEKFMSKAVGLGVWSSLIGAIAAAIKVKKANKE